MTKPPEYYIQQIYSIKDQLRSLPDPSSEEYANILNADYAQLSLMNTELINTLKNIETHDTTQKPMTLYDEYKDLYLTYYFTNISLLLGICLLIRYIFFYINI